MTNSILGKITLSLSNLILDLKSLPAAIVKVGVTFYYTEIGIATFLNFVTLATFVAAIIL